MYQRILVPVDGSDPSTLGLDEAIRLAKLTGAALRLVYVVDSRFYRTAFDAEPFRDDIPALVRVEGGKILATASARATSAGIAVETELIDCLGGRTADAVIECAQAWKADLVVLGTHGRRGVRRFMLGSDAEQILRQATVPVLLVRNPAT